MPTVHFHNQAHKTEGGKHTNGLFLYFLALCVSAFFSLRAYWKQRVPPCSAPRLLLSYRSPGEVQQFDGHRYKTARERPLIELPLAAIAALHSQPVQHGVTDTE